MPVHNGERYLDSAIESMIRQDFDDFEFIIVDDGSVDRSADILNNWQDRDKRIRVITQKENCGLPKSLNNGLSHCRAELIARMDCDDLSEPERLRIQVNFMDQHPDIVASGAQALLIDPCSRSICKGSVPTDHENIDAMLLKGMGSAIYHPLVIMRKSSLDRIGGYDESVELEDLDLFLRLAEIGTLANLPDYLLKYRLHLKSTNHQRREIHAKCAMQTVEAAIWRRGIEQKYEVPNKPQLDGTISGIYQDWAYKAFLGGYAKTGWVHCLNVFFSSFRHPSSFPKFLKLVIFGLRHGSSRS